MNAPAIESSAPTAALSLIMRNPIAAVITSMDGLLATQIPLTIRKQCKDKYALFGSMELWNPQSTRLGGDHETLCLFRPAQIPLTDSCDSSHNVEAATVHAYGRASIATCAASIEAALASTMPIDIPGLAGKSVERRDTDLHGSNHLLDRSMNSGLFKLIIHRIEMTYADTIVGG
ncbi:MAG: FMN-binding negative transcriptional regulator [Pseudomonadota bacterium]